MINRVKGKVNHDEKKINLASWDDVIEDIGRQIEDSRKRTAGLKRIEKNFKNLRDLGTPFTGTGTISATHS